MNNSSQFYDNYHKKNDNYHKIFNTNNFTYYYISQFLQKVYEIEGNKLMVLDIGCGVGSVTLFMSKLFRFVFGIDISKDAIKIANLAKEANSVKNVKFINGQMANFKGIFNFITAFEIIEHIENDHDFLCKINDSLSKKGLLLLSTPLNENIFVNSDFYKKFDKEVGHLRRYSVSSITKLLQESNFDVVYFKKTESVLRNILFLLKLDLLIKLIRGPLVGIFHIVDEFLIKYLGANNIIIIARKR